MARHILSFLLLLGACRPLSQPNASPTPDPHEDSTLTPATSTVTRLPPSATFEPTSTPSPTPSVMATEGAAFDCFVSANQPGVNRYAAPVLDLYRPWPTLEPGVAYDAVSVFPTFYNLQLQGQEVGWVDYRSLGLTLEGQDCANLPRDPRQLEDFPSLCFYVTGGPQTTYQDPMPTADHLSMQAGERVVVMVRYTSSYLVQFDHAMGSFVDPSGGRLEGSCAALPVAGTIRTATGLWSIPDSRQGERLTSLDLGLGVSVLEGPIGGPGPEAGSAEVLWFFVQLLDSNRATGWVPAQALDFP